MATSTPHDPPPSEALALAETLAEEMASRWQQGDRPRAEEYLARHPELADDPEAALELISAEIDLCQDAGQDPSGAELVRRFPRWHQQVLALLECHRVMAAEPLPWGVPTSDQPLGEFELLAEIGRGSHGRVFLARQPTLADRFVVLKLIPRAGQEHLCLARLQHTHIVPLHSVHDFPERGLLALCLPYFGGATLADLLTGLTARLPGQRTGRDLLEALRRCGRVSPRRAPARLGETRPHSGPGSLATSATPACQFLVRASYVQAVCWLGACLADALHYAHERGLVHLDLKASNVLLAADGQPMLLDFHLARGPLQAGQPAPAWLGGTPDCMAPEHEAALRAVAAGHPLPAAVDGRADIHALGRLLCELLGAPAHSAVVGAASRAAPRAAGPARLAGPTHPAVGLGTATRRHNPRVTRGLADLLDRCLAADPVRRYPSAATLAADLRRHLADLPLRGVPNWSLGERWRKWRRRRPYALPLLALVLGAVVAGGVLLSHAGRQEGWARTALREGQEHLGQHRPAQALDSFRRGAALAEDLPWGGALRRQLWEARQQAERAQAAEELHRFCERLRPLYGADVLPAGAGSVAGNCRQFWQTRAEVRRCLDEQADPALRTQTRADLLDLAIVWTHLQVRLARPSVVARSGDRATTEAHREALAVLTCAEEELGPSRVLHLEQRTHALALGLVEVAERAGRRADALPPAGSWEHYALGRAHLWAGDVPAALQELDRAVQLEPGSFWPRFYRGCCACRLGQHDDAVVDFSVCQALAPGRAWCAYNRGLAYLELGKGERALHDLDDALRLDPKFASAALARGILHYREKRYEQARADLDGARRNGLDTAAVHFNLALVHRARQDRAAALASVREALRLDPKHPQARQLLQQLAPVR